MMLKIYKEHYNIYTEFQLQRLNKSICLFLINFFSHKLEQDEPCHKKYFVSEILCMKFWTGTLIADLPKLVLHISSAVTEITSSCMQTEEDYKVMLSGNLPLLESLPCYFLMLLAWNYLKIKVS